MVALTSLNTHAKNVHSVAAESYELGSMLVVKAEKPRSWPALPAHLVPSPAFDMRKLSTRVNDFGFNWTSTYQPSIQIDHFYSKNKNVTSWLFRLFIVLMAVYLLTGRPLLTIKR